MLVLQHLAEEPALVCWRGQYLGRGGGGGGGSYCAHCRSFCLRLVAGAFTMMAEYFQGL